MNRSSVLAIVLLCRALFAPYPAHAQGNTIEGTKSPGRALLYSFAGTAIPVGIGTAFALGQNELSPGSVIAIGGAILGPSVGHFYAQRPGRAILGIVARSLGGAMVWAAVEAESGGEELFTAGFLLGTAFVVADILSAPHSARVHNDEVAERGRLGVAPWVGPIAGAPGAGVRLTF